MKVGESCKLLSHYDSVKVWLQGHEYRGNERISQRLKFFRKLDGQLCLATLAKSQFSGDRGKRITSSLRQPDLHSELQVYGVRSCLKEKKNEG